MKDQPKVFRCERCGHSYDMHDVRFGHCKRCTCKQFKGPKPAPDEETTNPNIPAPAKPAGGYCPHHGIPLVDGECQVCTLLLTGVWIGDD